MGGICSGPPPINEEDLKRLEKTNFVRRKEILKLYKAWEVFGVGYYDQPNFVLSNKLSEHFKCLKVCFSILEQLVPKFALILLVLFYTLAQPMDSTNVVYVCIQKRSNEWPVAVDI